MISDQGPCKTKQYDTAPLWYTTPWPNTGVCMENNKPGPAFMGDSNMQVNQAMPSEADVYIALKYRIVVDKAGRRLCLNHNGDPHCEDGPAIVWADGTKEWWVNGVKHRSDGPAVELANGDRHWICDGEVHRTDGPAAVYNNGTEKWYRNGKLHRENGPAIVWANGTKGWYQNGLHHREDGPAVEFPSGMHKWCLNGIIFSQQRYYKRLAELGFANDH